MGRLSSIWSAVALLSIIGLTACEQTPEMDAERERRRSPISIRGWIWDVEAAAPGMRGAFSVTDPVQAEGQRKTRILAETNLSLEDVDYASGALLENGSFIILDAPPRSVTVVFQTPVLGDHSVRLQNIPPNADVLIPGIIISETGLRIAEPERLQVRVPGSQRRPTGQMATIGDHKVPIEEVPLAELVDRRDYPTPEPPAQQ